MGYQDSGDYEEFTLSFTESGYKDLDTELELDGESYITIGQILTQCGINYDDLPLTDDLDDLYIL